MENASSAPVVAPVAVAELSSAALSPIQPGDINQPVFESPVAPPPASENNQITETVATIMAATTALALGAAVPSWKAERSNVTQCFSEMVDRLSLVTLSHHFSIEMHTRAF